MITFENVSKQYGSTVVLQKASGTLQEKDRTGLVGVNGSGKTTLLRMLFNQEQPDSGSIQKPSSLRVDYLPQEIETFDDQTPLEIVLDPFKELLNYEETMHNIASGMDKNSDEKDTLRQLDKLHAQMEFHDGFSLRSRAESILSGLGITKEFWSLPVQVLSGGYRMRAVLGKLLLSSPDYLLLDEPTNHLDMDSLVWLEKFLLRYKGGMLIVSHDRDFLNRVSNSIVEISNSVMTLYKGNYDAYVNTKQEQQEQAASRAKNLETQIAHAEKFVERFKAKATKATQAQSRMKLIENLKSELPVSFEGSSRQLRFKIPLPKPSGVVPLKLTNIETGYGENTVFSNLSLSINRGEKIAIVGPNGAGKSTLLKVLAGIIPVKSGNFELGYNTILRYFGQHQLEQLKPDKTLYETVAQESVNTEKTFIRNILGAFLFSGDAVDKVVKVLSGGEKSRLVLATIMASPGNTLLLDEPTNHLDIQSVEVLADSLADYEGTMVFVSHDDYFVSKIATRIIEIRPGLVRDFPGTLNDYRSYIEQGFEYGGEQQTSQKKSEERPEIVEKQQRIQERESRKKLTRGIEKIEKEIALHEENIAKFEVILHDPSNGMNHALLMSTTQDIEKEQSDIEKCMSQWENLQNELEVLGSE